MCVFESEYMNRPFIAGNTKEFRVPAKRYTVKTKKFKIRLIKLQFINKNEQY